MLRFCALIYCIRQQGEKTNTKRYVKPTVTNFSSKLITKYSFRFYSVLLFIFALQGAFRGGVRGNVVHTLYNYYTSCGEYL